MVMPVATPMAKLMPNSTPQKLRHALPDLAARHDVHRLHDDQDHGQPEGERHEQEVIQRGERELQPRDVHQTKIDHRGFPPGCAAPGGGAGDGAGDWSAKRWLVVTAVTGGRCAGEKNSPQSTASAAAFRINHRVSSRRSAVRHPDTGLKCPPLTPAFRCVVNFHFRAPDILVRTCWRRHAPARVACAAARGPPRGLLQAAAGTCGGRPAPDLQLDAPVPAATAVVDQFAAGGGDDQGY